MNEHQVSEVKAREAARDRVPSHTLAALDRYINDHIPTGDFLQAVLSHDLFRAVDHADESNAAALVDIVRYIYNHVPGSAHGSSERYRDWIMKRR